MRIGGTQKVFRKRFIALLTVFALIFGLCACGNASSDAGRPGEGATSPAPEEETEIPELLPVDGNGVKREKADLTLLVYMIGSDLESKTAAASDDIEEMVNSGVDSDKINLLVYTGGCQYWHNGIPADANYLYRYDSDAGDMVREMATDSLFNMAAPGTLTGVLDHVAAHFPADHYGLVCWDHGTGSVIGYGSDQLFDNASLNLRQFAAALEKSEFGRGAHFDFIGFDACLMGSLETAVALAPYADYLIASEETEPGAGWDYSALAGLTGTEGAVQFAKNIIDTYSKLPDEYAAKSRSAPDITLSCMDLSKTGAVVDALDGLCGDMEEQIDSEYIIISNLRNRTKEFSAGGGLDQADLGHFALLAEKKWPESAKKLRGAIDEMVVYQSTNVPNASGVSFYFPYSGMTLYEDGGTDSLGALYGGKKYSGFIRSFLNAKAKGKEESYGLGTPELRGDEFVLSLSDAQKETLAEAYYTVYENMHDGGYVPVLREVRLTPDGDGNYTIPARQKALFWTNAQGEHIICPSSMTESSEERSCFQTEVLLCTNPVFKPYFQSEFCEIRVAVPAGEDKGVIQSVVLASDGKPADRNELELEDYSFVWVNYLHSYAPVKNKKNETLPFREWEENSTTWFTYGQIGTDYGFAFDELENYDDSYVIQITLRDVFGNEFSSDLLSLEQTRAFSTVEQAVDGGKLVFHVYEDHAEMFELVGEIKDLVVPDHVAGKPVTWVRTDYYNEDAIITNVNTTLESVVLPDTVTELAGGAFMNCSALRKVRLSSSLVTIGDEAFAYAPLEKLELPDTLEYIGPGAFHGCSKYEYDLDTYDSSYTGIETVTLPAGIREVGEAAFTGCHNLKEIRISGSDLYKTEDGVLFSGDGETLLCYPTGKTAESYTVPDSVRVIGTGAFSGTEIKEIDAGRNLRELAPHAFYYCDTERIRLPDTLEKIGAYALANEKNFSDSHPALESVDLGPAVSKIGKCAFEGSRVQKFNVSEQNRSFSAKDNMLFDKSGTVLLCVDTEAAGTLTVPEGVVTVAEYALDGCTKIEELVFPDSVVNFEDSLGTFRCRVSIGAGLKNVADLSDFDNMEITLSPDNPYFRLEKGKLTKIEED